MQKKKQIPASMKAGVFFAKWHYVFLSENINKQKKKSYIFNHFDEQFRITWKTILFLSSRRTELVTWAHFTTLGIPLVMVHNARWGTGKYSTSAGILSSSDTQGRTLFKREEKLDENCAAHLMTPTDVLR